MRVCRCTAWTIAATRTVNLTGSEIRSWSRPGARSWPGKNSPSITNACGRTTPTWTRPVCRCATAARSTAVGGLCRSKRWSGSPCRRGDDRRHVQEPTVCRWKLLWGCSGLGVHPALDNGTNGCCLQGVWVCVRVGTRRQRDCSGFRASDAMQLRGSVEPDERTCAVARVDAGARHPFALGGFRLAVSAWLAG